MFAFHERGDEVAGYGPKISDLLMASMMANPDIYLLDRAEMSKILEEAEINLSGMVNPSQAIQIGQLSGAQIFITGSIMSVSDKIIIVAKIIGTETSRVLGASVKGSADTDLDVLAEQLGEKINSLISAEGGNIIASRQTQKDVTDRIQAQMKNQTKPTLIIAIQERHLGRNTLDPAAETEWINICQAAGFEVLGKQNATKKKADLLIEGEGFSEFATRIKNLVSCKARLEIKVTDAKTGKLITADRQVAIAVDLAEQIAGKTALQKAAFQLAERVLPRLAQR
ncbi:MAG: hypothetical protein C0403_03495 [Desulfobacterium sp.]|nr:hypothetical protein [Desulfobacterium sp.]